MLLEKNDVSIYYEVFGEGEPLLLVHGVIVDADLYRNAAEILKQYYKVIIYDRRGISRSKFKDAAVPAGSAAPAASAASRSGKPAAKLFPAFSIDEQVEDIRDLLDVLDIENAYIFGASAGAVVAGAFLEKYPERVRHLIMYEPAILGMMRDEPETDEWIRGMNELVARRKFINAVLRFAENIASYDTRSPKKDRETSAREAGNMEYALTTEFPGFVAYMPDLDSLSKHASKITFAAGEKSDNTLYVRAAKKLADLFEKEVIYYPGYHNLPFDLPKEFAISIIGTLALSEIC